MSRDIGTAIFAANFEPRKAAPLDARLVVDNKADLVLLATWNKGDGNAYVYKGMLVSVVNDVTSENNGVYQLTSLIYSDISNWSLLGSGSVSSSAENVSWILNWNAHEFYLMQPLYYYPNNGSFEGAGTYDMTNAATHIVTKVIDENNIEIGKIEVKDSIIIVDFDFDL